MSAGSVAGVIRSITYGDIGGESLAPVPVNTALPAISGTTTSGQVLSLSNGTWTNTPTGYAYQWFRDGVAVSGQTANTYTLGAGDVGAMISARVIASNVYGAGSPAFAAAVGPVSPGSSGGVLDFSDPANSNLLPAVM